MPFCTLQVLQGFHTYNLYIFSILYTKSNISQPLQIDMQATQISPLGHVHLIRCHPYIKCKKADDTHTTDETHREHQIYPYRAVHSVPENHPPLPVNPQLTMLTFLPY